MSSPERQEEIKSGFRRIRTGIAVGALTLTAGIGTTLANDSSPEEAFITVPIGEGVDGIPIDATEALGWTMIVCGAGLAGAGAAFERDARRALRQGSANGAPE